MKPGVDLFAGPGEAAALMRAQDWAATPLGAPDSWPSSLRTLVPIMLASRFAMRVLWGPDHIFLYNDAYRPVLGASKHPFAMGRPTRDSFGELWHVVGPLFERVLQGESISLDDRQLPLDRNGYLEECYFTLSYSPIPDDAGAIAGVLGVVHETTGRVLAQRRLKTLRDLSGAAVAESAMLACHAAAEALRRNPEDVPFSLIYLVDRDGASARLEGSTGLALPSPLAPPVLGVGANEPWPLATAAHTRALVTCALASKFGEVHAGAYPERVQAAVISPLYRPAGAHPAAFLVLGINPRRAFDDEYRTFVELASEQIATSIANAYLDEDRVQMMERERAAVAEAERSNRAKDEFLAIVSHELRNPLSAILGWTRMLQTAKLPEDKVAKALETIERNAVNQSQLIEDLLDISRIVAGTLRLELETVNFVDLIANAIESARPGLEAKQLQLDTVFDTTAAVLIGDAVRLQQVVWNLIANATKFTPSGGKITLVLSHSNSMIELEVRDTGMGISPEFLPHVFEQFKQADSTTTRKYGGLGLGLAISRNIVEMHGGTIEARSEGLRRGASFSIRLPVAPLRPQGKAPTGASAAWDCPPELDALHVLVVDDDVDGRQMIGEVLEHCGARVSLAGSVVEALAQFDRDRPDVLLSDIGMPDQDGYALIAQVRARSLARGGMTPAASLTAYAGVEDRRRALTAGFNMHVAKPVDPAELVAVIASLARFSRALQR